MAEQGETQKAFSVGQPTTASVEEEKIIVCEPEVCNEYFGYECVCPIPGEGEEGSPPPEGETSPPDGSNPPEEGTPPNGNIPPDDGGEPPPCKGISYHSYAPGLSAKIEMPESKEIVVVAGETLTLKGTGSPDPDKDIEISRAPNKDGSCSSSQKQVSGPPLIFTWRLWKEESSEKKILVGTIGWESQVQWEVPNEAGVYWIELVVDDDFNPDYDTPKEEKRCKKCTVYSGSDDPAARDWVKVKVTSPSLDVDIDSDNTNELNLPDRSQFEEAVEDVAGDDHRPGKVILVNADLRT